MTTSAVTLTPETLTNVCAAAAAHVAVTDGSQAQATNTATVSPITPLDTVYLKLTILQNDDNDTPTVPGSGTIVLTVVDVNSVTQLTGPAVGAVGSYYYAVPALAAGVFTAATTVTAGDSDNLRYQLDAIAVALDPWTDKAHKQGL